VDRLASPRASRFERSRPCTFAGYRSAELPDPVPRALCVLDTFVSYAGETLPVFRTSKNVSAGFENRFNGGSLVIPDQPRNGNDARNDRPGCDPGD
jgi:hypothetical protein